LALLKIVNKIINIKFKHQILLAIILVNYHSKETLVLTTLVNRCAFVVIARAALEKVTKHCFGVNDVKQHQIFELRPNKISKVNRSEIVDEHNGVKDYWYPKTNPFLL